LGGDVQQWFDRKQPPGISGRGASEGLFDVARGVSVETGDDQLGGPDHGRLDGWRIVTGPFAVQNGTFLTSRSGSPEPYLSHPVDRHAFDRPFERDRGVGGTLLT
jgi:hypothetical protein